MPSTSLRDCEAALAEAYVLGKTEFEQAHPGYTVIVTCTKRSVEEQFALYKIGRRQVADGSWVVDDAKRIVTKVDGMVKKSNHNLEPARAIDFAIVFNGKVLWNATTERLDDDGHGNVWAQAAECFKRHGAKWGGDWRGGFRDLPHIEL